MLFLLSYVNGVFQSCPKMITQKPEKKFSALEGLRLFHFSGDGNVR